MFVWLRGQGFESSVNKVFQKEKLVNSKTINHNLVQGDFKKISIKFSEREKSFKNGLQTFPL
jgi:hypothetical protein